MNGVAKGAVGKGLLVLLGLETADTAENAE